MKKWNVQTIVLTAMLAGLAGALMSLGIFFTNDATVLQD